MTNKKALNIDYGGLENASDGEQSVNNHVDNRWENAKHTFTDEFCIDCDSSYRSYVCMFGKDGVQRISGGQAAGNNPKGRKHGSIPQDKVNDLLNKDPEAKNG